MSNSLAIQGNNPAPAMPLTEAAQRSIVSTYGLTEKQWAEHLAVVSLELFKLRTAYPTQARNYSTAETDALTALWLEVFANIDRDVLHQAVIRFIAADRKGFFPAPGQIMGIVEQILQEIATVESRKRFDREIAELVEMDWLISEGEHCGNCAYSELETVVEKGEEQEKIYCLNPDSFYHAGKQKRIGTTRNKRCDLFRERTCKYV